MSPEPSAESLDQRLARILAVHFDPECGTPYWLDKADALGFDPRRVIRQATDLPRLGFMDAAELRRRPLSHFTPKAIWNARQDLVIVQTGGTLGAPIWAAYTPEEYEAAFVEPFIAAARHVGFPTGGAWLYVGPSGPHVIGRAARSIALATGAREPFCVDFDARWSMRLPAGSFAASRYLAHVVDQAMAIVRVQPITHIFSTPPVLLRLAETMSQDERRRILGVHYGGMAIAPELLNEQMPTAFPEATHLAGYGNTLFGCCLELDIASSSRPVYFPHGPRIVFGVCNDEKDPASVFYQRADAQGRCVFTRMDETMLIANMLERDETTIVAPPANGPAEFSLCGVAAPKTAERLRNPTTANLY